MARSRALLELIDQLPAASRFNEAFQNDPEQAKHLAQLPASDEEWAPKVRDYDLTATLLREVVERLTALYQLTHAVNAKGKAPDVKPFPTPFTEIDRVRARELSEWADSLISRLTPGHSGKHII